MKEPPFLNHRILQRSAVLLALLFTISGCTSFYKGAQVGAIRVAYSSYSRGDYARALGKLADAEGHLEIPAPRRAEICYLRARCVEGMGNRIEAASLYEFLIKTYPDSEFAARAKGRLEELRQKP